MEIMVALASSVNKVQSQSMPHSIGMAINYQVKKKCL